MKMFSRLLSKLFSYSITLKNGQSVHVRPINAEDFENILNIYQNLGDSSLYLRFNIAITPAFIKKVARETINNSLNNGKGIIAFVVAEDGKKVPAGQARYVKTSTCSAELCVTIRDEFQGLGLGKLLMKRLVTLAKENGVDELEAYINRQNKAMQSLLYKFQLPVFTEYDGRMVNYRLILNPKLAPQLTIAF